MWVTTRATRPGEHSLSKAVNVGPFMVTAITSPTAYEIDRDGTPDVVHYDRLLPYTPPEELPPSPLTPPSRVAPSPSPEVEDLAQPVDPEAELEVQAIVARRVKRSRKRNAPVTFEYLIRWKGYTEEDDTWEPVEHLSHCKRRLKAFNKAHPIRM